MGPTSRLLIKRSKISNTVRHSSNKIQPAQSCSSVRAVINETLRVFPPVPLNVRESRDAPCTLPPSDPTYSSDSPDQPFYVPGGTPIVYLPLLTSRNPALWGPDADVFDPERWIDPERLKRFTTNPTMYTPFSAGPRTVSRFPALSSIDLTTIP